MGYSLKRCPVVERFCGIAGLRLGAGFAAFIGMGWAALYLLAYGVGESSLRSLCVTGNPAIWLHLAHGILGVLLSAIHLLLLAGVVAGSDTLCELYVWSAAVLWVLVAAAGIFASAVAAAAGCQLFSVLYFLSILFTLAVSFYFSVVVANYITTIP